MVNRKIGGPQAALNEMRIDKYTIFQINISSPPIGGAGPIVFDEDGFPQNPGSQIIQGLGLLVDPHSQEGDPGAVIKGDRVRINNLGNLVQPVGAQLRAVGLYFQHHQEIPEAF